jgi:enterochelin esterase-like enzyme
VGPARFAARGPWMNRSLSLRRLAFTLALVVLAGARPSPGRAAPVQPSACPKETDRSPGRWLAVTIEGQHGAYQSKGQLHLYLPKGYRAGGSHPLVIALHGWNSPVSDWEKLGNIQVHAERLGAVVAVPDMGRTVYETDYFRESRLRNLTRRTPRVPGTPWIGGVVLPYLRRCLAVSRDRSRTAIIGYSTGGRGAVLVAQHYPEFGLVAGFSGTYDLETLRPGTGEYRIHANLYGEMRPHHRKRWLSEQSILPALVEKLRGARVMLAHGQQDPVVSFTQTTVMVTAMKTAGLVPAPVARIVPDAGHDWAFWRGEVQAAMEAFGTLLAPAPR